MNGREEFLDKAQETLLNSPHGMFQCRTHEDGGTPDEEERHLMVQTPLLYPGGGPVNVYVRANGSSYLVTDRGTALSIIGRHLPTTAGQAPGRWTPAAKKVCEGLEVEIRGAEWTANAKTPEDLGRSVMTLAQALLRMSIMATVFKIISEG